VYIALGLGNPGSEYENTRHNIGFKVVDRLAFENRVKFKVGKGAYFFVIIKDSSSQTEPFLVAKPLTYMNLSGVAAKDLLLDFNEKIDSLVVVHDDIDLDLGTLRIKRDGGSGGHKGVESIINSLGSPNFLRIKIGIGRPGNRDDVIDYVLSPFSKGEEKTLSDVILLAEEAILDLISKGFEYTANKFNGK
jgi:PTH1 family peptidyl-tRNA hydrolase